MKAEFQDEQRMVQQKPLEGRDKRFAFTDFDQESFEVGYFWMSRAWTLCVGEEGDGNSGLP